MYKAESHWGSGMLFNLMCEQMSLTDANVNRENFASLAFQKAADLFILKRVLNFFHNSMDLLYCRVSFPKAELAIWN